MDRKEGACLVCGEDLEYLDTRIELVCSHCGKAFVNNARCKNGHYICDECHSKLGIEHIKAAVLEYKGKNPLQLMQKIMENPLIYMHGPEHHVLVGAAILVAYKNAGGKLYQAMTIEQSVEEMVVRGKQVPGGACGFWGACGAALSLGIAVSIITGATPISGKNWGLCNRTVGEALTIIGKHGGPRCCKRNGNLAVAVGVEVINRELGVSMELPDRVVCRFSGENKQCLKTACIYNPANN